jgi:hypothetical protein
MDFEKDTLLKAPVTEKSGPNYDELWKDGVLRGVVVTGTNLNGDHGTRVMQEYLQHYIEEGFIFGNTTEVKSLKTYLKDKVIGDKPMDYFIKEAHSDGDEINLFKIDKTASVKIGRKLVGDKIEEIELVFPNKESSGAHQLSNMEFGEWMREREKIGLGQLVYGNSSCWSITKAIYEVSSARTPALLDIPTLTTMSTFANEPENPMRIFVDSIRQGKDFAGMAEALKANDEYKDGRSNIWLFPTDYRYREKITETAKTPVSVDRHIKARGADGIEHDFNIDDFP